MGLELTLTEALFKLHAAGKIAVPFPKGMRVFSPECKQHGRLVLANGSGVQLMEWEERSARMTWHLNNMAVWEVDFNDPATHGALLDLLREAGRDPALVVQPPQACWHRDSDPDEELDPDTLVVYDTVMIGEWIITSRRDYSALRPYNDKPWGSGETEGQAIANGLIQSAMELE